jgi:hypothetical protein
MLRRDMKANMDDNQLTSDPPPTASTEDEKRSPPPLVYRTNDVDIWVVEPPGGTVSAKGKRVFSGYRAQHQALTYAYEQFGSARFFPY